MFLSVFFLAEQFICAPVIRLQCELKPESCPFCSRHRYMSADGLTKSWLQSHMHVQYAISLCLLAVKTRHVPGKTFLLIPGFSDRLFVNFQKTIRSKNFIILIQYVLVGNRDKLLCIIDIWRNILRKVHPWIVDSLSSIVRSLEESNKPSQSLNDSIMNNIIESSPHPF